MQNVYNRFFLKIILEDSKDNDSKRSKISEIYNDYWDKTGNRRLKFNQLLSQINVVETM